MPSFPKEARVSDHDYLAWCRRQRCSFCSGPAPVEAHHTRLKGMGGAYLRDDLAVPACRLCHMRCHGQYTVTGCPLARTEQADQARRARERYEAESRR